MHVVSRNLLHEKSPRRMLKNRTRPFDVETSFTSGVYLTIQGVTAKMDSWIFEKKYSTVHLSCYTLYVLYVQACRSRDKYRG